VVFYKHALRNSIRPLITGISAGFSRPDRRGRHRGNNFCLPRHGTLGYEAVLERDYPTLVALNFIVAGLVLIGNLISDVSYAVVDPRVRLEYSLFNLFDTPIHIMKTLLLCLACLVLTTIAKADQALGYPVQNPLISFSAPTAGRQRSRTAASSRSPRTVAMSSWKL